MQEKDKVTLTEEQRRVVESRDTRIAVVASAGSGKTRTLTERIRWILKKGGDPNKMVALTFTNNAADEMRERLGEDYRDGMFVGTIHSYANQLLTRYNINTSKIRNKGDFDELFSVVEENSQVIRPIGLLCADETQDLTNSQYRFIFDVLRPSAFFAVGDPKQCIYEWAGVDPLSFLKIANRGDIARYNLVENHRNARAIIKEANKIMNKMYTLPKMPVKAVREEEGNVENIRERNITEKIFQTNRFDNWAILCRTNARVNTLRNKLERAGIPTLTFKQAENGREELEGKIKSNNVKVLTIHACKGLQFDNVIIADQVWYSDEDIRLMYVATTRARNQLFWVVGK